jgi:hypothetical protein
MGQSKTWVPLRDAIRTLIPSEKWSAIVKLVGDSPEDALASLSGQLAGRLFLDAAIAANSIYAASERSRIREFEKLRLEVVNCLEAQRRGVALVLKGYTAASSARPITISPDLALEYDFSDGTARTGELKFYGVTVCRGADGLAKVDALTPSPAVAQAELQDFCERWLADRSPIPAMEALWHEAKKAFPKKHVTRERVRALHKHLIEPHLRKSGPRKKPEQTAMPPSRRNT